MSLLASNIMDTVAKVYLNDAAKSIFTYTAQLPILNEASRELSKVIAIFSSQETREVEAEIEVDTGDVDLTLPSDFFSPVRLWERERGGSDSSWMPMIEKRWVPEQMVQTNTLNYWTYQGNGIKFIGSTADRDVKLEYIRQLDELDSNSDPIDSNILSAWLATKTAEMCARLIGMNSTHADLIRDNYFLKASWDLENYLTLESQGLRERRQKFSVKNTTYIVR